MKILFKIGYYVILLSVAVIAILLFLPALPIQGNIDAKVVLSGSMEPSIHVGSMIILKPQSDYGVDDVITFGKDTKDAIPTTHRIVAERLENGTKRFQTQGDANNDPDAFEISEKDIKGKVLLSIPYLGYIVDFAKKPIGFALLIIVPGAIVVLDEVRKIVREIARMRKKSLGKLETGKRISKEE